MLRAGQRTTALMVRYRGLHASCAAQQAGDTNRVVIVGGVAGGATAAARLRRLSERVEIVLLERGNDVSFANCGLPYYIGDEIKERSSLLLHTPQSLATALRADVRSQHEVVAILRDSKQVAVRRRDDPSGDVVHIDYDKLLLSTGASPVRPPIPGIDQCSNVFSLRSMADMDRISAHVAGVAAPARATVIGAGFIGLEMVEALLHRGLHVTLIEARDQVLPQLDHDMAQPILQELLDKGVDVVLSDRVTAFEAQSSRTAIKLESGRSVDDNQLVILSIGVRPDSQLAEQAGLRLHPRTRAVMVNEFLQTSDVDIYAVGDVAQTRSRWSVSEEDDTNWVPLAGPANRQARIAAENMLSASPERSYYGSLGTAIVRFGDVVTAVTGYTEASLRRLGKTDADFASLLVSGYSHASYYPGARPLFLKVTYDRLSRRILGAQATGADGVDKRVDVLATAIAADMTVDKLEHLELCYAPPFGAARDIVNTAGFLAYNTHHRLVDTVQELPAPSSDPNAAVLLDLRPDGVVPVPGAKHIPYAQLPSRLAELNPKAHITTVCTYGKTSYFAARLLMQSGFSAVQSLMGGWTFKRPVVVPTQQPSSSSSSSSTRPAATVATAAGAPAVDVEIDCCGVSCPGPIMKLRQRLPDLKAGQVVRVLATDSGFGNDFQPFCSSVGVEFLGITKSKGVYNGLFRVAAAGQSPAASSPSSSCSSGGKDVAIVLFSGDLDKALAALVIANGAIALGGKATIFCTFWGLNSLRQEGSAPAVKKSLMDRMMAWMMPRGLGALSLSQMHMMGAGTAMMKKTMADKQLPNVHGLLRDGLASGRLDLVACGMSMDALGIQKEELLPEAQIGGVAQFLSIAQQSKTTLFI